LPLKIRNPKRKIRNKRRQMRKMKRLTQRRKGKQIPPKRRDKGRRSGDLPGEYFEIKAEPVFTWRPAALRRKMRRERRLASLRSAARKRRMLIWCLYMELLTAGAAVYMAKRRLLAAMRGKR